VQADKKAHILFVQSSSDLYGSDRCLINITSGLSQKGYRISVVVPYHGPLVEELKVNGIKTWVLEPIVLRKQLLGGYGAVAKFMLRTPGAVRTLSRLMRDENVDLVHSNTGVVIGGALAARRCGLPHVWHFREVFSEFKKAWRWYEPFVARYSTRILCISEAVRSQFRSDSARGKTRIVYDGINMATVSEEEVATPAACDGSSFRIVCTGRINPPVKGQDLLVEATRKVLDMGIPVEVSLVGDVFPGRENLKVELQNKIDVLKLEDKVKITGFQDEIVAWIDGSDLVVVPSRHPEGFGIVILEAFARGKPVIGSNIGGIPEIIKDGENGLLVPPGDVDALANAIASLYREPDLRQRLALAGRNTLEARFSANSTVDRLDKIYRELLTEIV
jgi:glycosyltransferase involved in cell wall biosynthesis